MSEHIYDCIKKFGTDVLTQKVSKLRLVAFIVVGSLRLDSGLPTLGQ